MRERVLVRDEANFYSCCDTLQVVLNHNSPSTTSVYGFQVPTKYAAWLELVVIHLLVPHSSFMGHMCGILAGMYAWVHFCIVGSNL